MPSDANDVPDTGTLSPDGRTWTAHGYEWFDAADEVSLRPDQIAPSGEMRREIAGDAGRKPNQRRKRR